MTKCDKGVGGRFVPNIVWRRLWTASFLLVWDFCFFLVIVVSEVGVHSSGLCVEHSVYLYCSVLAVYLWRLWDIAVNLCFAPSIADFRHPFLLYCFTVTSFRHPFLLYCFTVTTFLFFVCITWIAWLDSAVKCLICCIFHLSIHSVFLFCAFKVVLIHSVRISSSRESFIVASAGVWRGSWLFGVVVAAVVFSACARFLVSCTVLFWVWSISSWLWPLIPNLTAVLTHLVLGHWELKWNWRLAFGPTVWLAFGPIVVVLWCSNAGYVVPRLCAFFFSTPCRWIAEEVAGHDFLGFLACPFPTFDGWVTWLITRASWGCNDWRRPCWSGRRLNRRGFIFICTLHGGGCGSSGFVKEATFSFPGLAYSIDCGFAAGLNLRPFDPQTWN